MKSERGSAAIELTLITPLLLILLLLVVAGGRLTNARSDIDAAARDGARSASLARSATQARADAEATVNDALASRGIKCGDTLVSVDTVDFKPGGNVSVDVTCNVDLSDVTLLPLPSVQTLDASFTEVVDTYRETVS